MSGLTTHASNFYPRGFHPQGSNVEMNHGGNIAEGLYSKVTNPLFSTYYQKKSEWDQLRSNQASDLNVRFFLTSRR